MNLYDLLIRYIVLGLSHIEQAFDAYVVDGMVNGMASRSLALDAMCVTLRPAGCNPTWSVSLEASRYLAIVIVLVMFVMLAVRQ